jgi:hypothetical protein
MSTGTPESDAATNTTSNEELEPKHSHAEFVQLLARFSTLQTAYDLRLARSTSNFPLQDLPVILVQRIAEQLEDLKDIVAFSRVNKALFSAVTPVLYRSAKEDQFALTIYDDRGCGFKIGRLHEAVRMGRKHVVKQLLKYGANFNDKDMAKQATPLHWAATYGHIGLVEMLLKKGADVHAQDFQGDTPLLWALTTGCGSSSRFRDILCSIMSLLVIHGARHFLEDRYTVNLRSNYHTPRG